MTLVLRSAMYFLELGLEPLFEVGHRHQSAEHAVRLGFLATGHGFSVHALGFQRRVVGFMCLLACPPAVPVERVLGEHKNSETQSGVRPASKSNPLIPNIFLIFDRQMPDRTRRCVLPCFPALKCRRSCINASVTSLEGQPRLYFETQGSTLRPLWRGGMDSFKDSRGGWCGLRSTGERAHNLSSETTYPYSQCHHYAPPLWSVGFHRQRHMFLVCSICQAATGILIPVRWRRS